MGLAMLVQPVPVIEISLAPLEESATDHCSPFSWDNKPSSGPLEESIDYNNEGDEYRPTYLSPPPTHVRFAASPKAVSPLGLNNMTRSKAGDGKGLDADRFEALLKASRERKVTPVVGPKKEDLRKEILSNAHKNKQMERRALFLSKLAEPPSPSATSLPKTPPETPSVFHYTLPSPGLVSPLALFDSLNNGMDAGPFSYARSPWVEQVDYRKTVQNNASLESVKKRRLPSLDEISARLQQGPAPLSIQRPKSGSTRLPAFLSHARRHSDPTEHVACSSVVESKVLAPVPTLVRRHTDPEPPTTSSRERKAQDMFSALRRRVDNGVEQEQDRRVRRRSAPAELTRADRRSGFEHPVLSLPGAF